MSVEKPPFIENFKNLSDQKLGVYCMLLGSSLFGIGYAFLKLAGDRLNSFSVAFWNDVFALIAILIVGFASKSIKRTIASKYKGLHILRSVFFTIGFVSVIHAVSLMPIANVLSLSFTAPIIATILSIIILKEYPRMLHWIAIGLGFLGILIIVKPQGGTFNTDLIYPLATAVFFACGIVVSRKVPSSEPKMAFGFYPIIVTLAISGAYLAFHFENPNMQEIVWLCVSGFVGGIGALLVGYAFALARTASVAPLEYVQLVWGVILGYFIFGDVLDLRTALGAALIIVSGVILVRFAEIRKRET